MDDIAIRVEGLSKKYRIGERQERYRTLRDTLAEAAVAPFQRLRSVFRHGAREGNGGGDIWALKDVSFEVKRGEVVGIIGRNGAGKSTLLKILSRITEPTEGLAEVYGRVGSLLEVGTGFHSELTGRENLYLNGAILGMKRSEIERQFDEIVAFAEVEKFIDTPVKHYSSGMYLRLAFAVAAHLEPEILLVDEVLAVGDVAFQKKCLNKMQGLACQGRTVLFVSHNMNAISILCDSALLMAEGRITARGTASWAVNHYLSESASSTGRVCLDGDLDAVAHGSTLHLRAVSLEDEAGEVKPIFASSEPIYAVLEFDIGEPSDDLCIGFDLSYQTSGTIFRSYHNDQAQSDWPQIHRGTNRLRCRLPGGLLNDGRYFVSPRIGRYCKEWLIKLDNVVSFQVTLAHGVSPFWTALDGSNRPGAIAPIMSWEAV
jgi:lipopolysaccharide transport system ATP-binding protein